MRTTRRRLQRRCRSRHPRDRPLLAATRSNRNHMEARARARINPSRKDNPVRMALSLARRVLSPARRVLSPAKRVHSPAKRVLSPAKRVHSPAKRVHIPAKRILTPARRALSPAKRVHIPARKALSLVIRVLIRGTSTIIAETNGRDKMAAC
jgi:hypothetical protein